MSRRGRELSRRGRELSRRHTRRKPNTERTQSDMRYDDSPLARLLRAAKDNDVDVLETLMKEGQDPNQANSFGQTALHICAIWGNVQAAHVLLDCGANLDVQNDHGMTPLHYAAERGRVDIVALLVDAGADVTLMTDKGGRTAFELTEDEVIQDLLGAPKRECHDAVKQRDVAKLTAALSDETSGIEALDTDGNTALHLAVEVGATEPGVALELAKTFCGALSAEALRSLLMTRSSKTGYTPLQLACDVAQPPLVRCLVDAGTLINIGKEHLDARSFLAGGFNDGNWGKKDAAGQLQKLDNLDETALHVAIQRLARVLDIDESSERTEAELDYSARIIKMLIESGCDVNVLNRDGATALHLAVSCDRCDIVQLLIANKADLTIGGKAIGTGNTALHYAVQQGNPEMVKLICDTDVIDVDGQGAGGWTPLGLAVRVNNTAVVDILLAKGAWAEQKMKTGKSPLDIARINNRVAIIEAIERSAKRS